VTIESTKFIYIVEAICVYIINAISLVVPFI